MLIECRARRIRRDLRVGRRDSDEGTKAKLFGKTYWFRPQPNLLPAGVDPAVHVCLVEDERAIERFVIGLPEQFNEVGKPPRVQRDKGPRVAPGQLQVVTELIDSDDELGSLDAPVDVDPMRAAKALHQQWINDMLDQPVKTIGGDLHRFHADELAELIEGEKAGQNRKTLLAGLEEALVDAKARLAGIPRFLRDDAPDDVEHAELEDALAEDEPADISVE